MLPLMSQANNYIAKWGRKQRNERKKERKLTSGEQERRPPRIRNQATPNRIRPARNRRQQPPPALHNDDGRKISKITEPTARPESGSIGLAHRSQPAEPAHARWEIPRKSRRSGEIRRREGRGRSKAWLEHQGKEEREERHCHWCLSLKPGGGGGFS